MNTIKNTRSLYSAFFLCCCWIILFSCKKNETPIYKVSGKVTDAVTGAPLADVNVKIEKQTLSGSSFNGVFNLADQTNTDGNGNYTTEWERENIVELRANLAKGLYIPIVSALSVNTLNANEQLVSNFAMYPESNVKINILKNPNLTQNQQINFRFENASFDCFCCNNDWISYTPSISDTSKTCKVYGDRWLKYRYELIRANQDSLVRDSIYCPRFEVVETTISW